jgi:SAM-dependent methyltransferase
MRLTSVPENIVEAAALVAGAVPTPLMDTLVGLLLAKTIMAATAVEIFDALDSGPLGPNAVAARCGSDPRATEKLMRALYACRYLELDCDRFALAPVARRWLTRHSSQPLAAAVLHRTVDLRFMTFEDFVRSGESRRFHEHLTPEEWTIYHAGQASHAELVIREVVESLPPLSEASSVLDVGGGNGRYAIALCERYPRLRARVLDLSSTAGREAVRALPDSIRTRIDFETRDLRDRNLCGAYDFMLMANIVHHFDEATNSGLLRAAARVLRPGGSVVVLDAVRPASVKSMSQIDGLLDLYFAAVSGTGLWTVDDIRGWMTSAGLSLSSPRSMTTMPFCKMQRGTK